MAIFSSTAAVALNSQATETQAAILEINMGTTGSFPTAVAGTVNGDLKTLLTDIESEIGASIGTAGISQADIDVLKAAESRVAALAGFELSAGVSVYNASATAKNLDKLTFYIMFRLPWVHSSLNGKYDNPLTGSATSWSRKANNIRGITAASLNKLNAAGEEVNNSNTPIYDWTTLSGYNHIGATALFTSDGFSSFSSSLFPSSGTANNVPASFYRIAMDENPYTTYTPSAGNALGNYRKPHWPHISGDHSIDYSSRRYFAQRPISTVQTLTIEEQKNLQGKIIQGTNGNYSVTLPGLLPFPTVDILKTLPGDPFDLAGCEILVFRSDSSSNVPPVGYKELNAVELENFPGAVFLYARKPDTTGNAMTVSRQDHRRYLVENYFAKSKESSGFTMGFGIDLGAAFARSFRRSCKWRFIFQNAGPTKKFRIHLGLEQSVEIDTVDPASGDNVARQIQDAMWKLLAKRLATYDKEGNLDDATSLYYIRQCTGAKKAEKFTKVLTASGTPTTNIEIILNAPHAFVEGEEFFSSDEDISITDLSSSMPERSSTTADWDFSTTWAKLETLFTSSFQSIATGNTWVEEGGLPAMQGGVPSSEATAFREHLKNQIGVRLAKTWVYFRNNFELIRSFGFKNNPGGYIAHLRVIYSDFYRTNYYLPAWYTVRGKSSNPFVHTEPNEAERFVIGSMAYNKGSVPYTKDKDDYDVRDILRDAINQHDLNLLIKAVNKTSWAGGTKIRRNNILKFLGKTSSTHSSVNPNVSTNLYRGIDPIQ